jgi:hypothetical protein
MNGGSGPEAPTTPPSKAPTHRYLWVMPDVATRLDLAAVLGT